MHEWQAGGELLMRALLCAALLACSGAGQGNDDVSVSDHAQVMDTELREMTQVLPDRIVVTTARDDVHRKLFGMIGTTFVAGRKGDEDGFVREVLSVERNGNVTTLMTETSSLSKVIDKGHVIATQDWASSSGISTQALGKAGPNGEIVIPPTVLFDAGALGKFSQDGRSVLGQVKLDGGTFRFSPKVDIDADYDHGLQEFHFDAKGDVEARMVMSANVQLLGKATKSDAVESGPIELFESPRVRSAFLVGIVPVEMATSVVLEAKCSVQLEQTVSITAGGTLSGSMSTGVDWKKGRGLSTHGQKPSFHFTAFANAKTEQAIELECNMTLGLKVLFYETAGASLNVGPYAKARVDRSSEGDAKLSLWAGAKAELEGKFEIFGKELTLEPHNPLFVWPEAQADKPAKVYDL